MTTAIAPTPTATSSDSSDLNHVYCCDPNLSLCGLDLSDVPETDFDVASCVVCADLDEIDASCGPDCPSQAA